MPRNHPGAASASEACPCSPLPGRVDTWAFLGDSALLVGSAASESVMAGATGPAELPLMPCAEACRATAAADSATAAALSGLAASAAALASSGCSGGAAESELAATATAWARCCAALCRACPRLGLTLELGDAAPAAAVDRRPGSQVLICKPKSACTIVSHTGPSWTSLKGPARHLSAAQGPVQDSIHVCT